MIFGNKEQILYGNRFNGTKGNGYQPIKKEQTNEEWLRSCTTEELVKMILDLCDDRPCFACGIGYCDDEDWCHVDSDEAKEFVTKWLKQPHTTRSDGNDNLQRNQKDDS